MLRAVLFKVRAIQLGLYFSHCRLRPVGTLSYIWYRFDPYLQLHTSNLLRRAVDQDRTGDILLGRQKLYRLSYHRIGATFHPKRPDLGGLGIQWWV